MRPASDRPEFLTNSVDNFRRRWSRIYPIFAMTTWNDRHRAFEGISDQLWLECLPNVCAEKGQSARIKEPVYLSAGKMRQRLNATYVPWENALHTWKRLTETMVIVQETLMKNFLHRPDTMKDEGALEWGSAYIEPHTAFRPKQFWRRVRTDHLLESQRHYIRMCFKGSENDVYDDWFPPGWRKRLKEASQSEHQTQKSASVAVPEDQTREDRALSQGARTTERLRPMPTILWTDSSGSSSSSFSRSASSRQAFLFYFICIIK